MYRLGLSALVLIQLVGIAILTQTFGQVGFDDAFISYRYAWNFVQGHGLVFNPGERVEGYSNFLYTLFMAAGLIFTPKFQIYWWSLFINVLCLTGVLLLFVRLVRERLGESKALLAGLLIAVNPMFWNAAWSGMETVVVLLFFLLQWYGFHRLESKQRGGAAILAFASIGQILTRADGFVLVLIVCVCLAWRSHWRALAATGLAGGVAFAVHVAWRYNYYGYPLPNTYYVKVSGPLSERIAFAARQLTYYPIVEAMLIVTAAAIAVGLLAAMLNRRDPRRFINFEMAFCAGWIAYWFYIGGDILGFRFLLVVIPPSLYLAVRHVLPRIPWRTATAVLVAWLIWLPFKTPTVYTDNMTQDTWAELGKFLGEKHPGRTLAIDAAGKVPYFSGLYTIDMLGLNDPVIGHQETDYFVPGHNKRDPAYVLSREPDLIASWLIMGTLGFGWKLRPEVAEDGSYSMAYVAHIWYDRPPWGTIVPVRGLSDEAIKNLHYYGYRYGVKARHGIPVERTTLSESEI